MSNELYQSPYKGSSGIKRLINALVYSMKGLRASWLHEAAFRQELLLSLIMIPLAFLVTENNMERALLIASLLLVLIIELLNSAIEAVVDRVGLEYHELSARAKDIGSAAVFVSLVLAGVVWSLILL